MFPPIWSHSVSVCRVCDFLFIGIGDMLNLCPRTTSALYLKENQLNVHNVIVQDARNWSFVHVSPLTVLHEPLHLCSLNRVFPQLTSSLYICRMFMLFWVFAVSTFQKEHCIMLRLICKLYLLSCIIIWSDKIYNCNEGTINFRILMFKCTKMVFWKLMSIFTSMLSH